MKLRFFLSLPIAASSLFGAAPALAAPPAGLLVELPAAAQGWTEKDAGDGIVLQKQYPGSQGHASGGALIEILKPVPFSQNGFVQQFAKLAGAVPELARDKPLVQNNGVTQMGDQIMVKDYCCQSRGDIGLAEVVVGIYGRGQQGLASLVQLNLDSDQKKAVEADFQAIIRSWRLQASDPAFGINPAKDGGGLDGIYTNLETGLMPNAFGGMNFYSNDKITVFYPNGIYVREIPPDGQDAAAFCADKPLSCGTYRLTGGGLFGGPQQIEQLEMSNLYGIFDKTSKPLAHNGDDLKIGDANYHHVPPLPKGMRLDGEWRYSFAQAGMTATSSGSVAVERGLTLTSDGRYTRTGWSGASGSNSMGGTTTGFTASNPRGTQTGRYQIDGYHLVLTGDDGQTETLSIFEPDMGSDKLLTIDGDNYLKSEG